MSESNDIKKALVEAEANLRRRLVDELKPYNDRIAELQAENAELREQIERLKREVLEWAWEDCRTYVDVDYIVTFHRLEKILEGESTDGKEGIEEA